MPESVAGFSTTTMNPPRSRLDLLRWQAGLSTFAVPQAAAPIAFALLALPLTGSAESGAALVLALTSSLVLFGLPVTRLGRRFNSLRYLRALLVIRASALVGLVVLAALKAPFIFLIAPVVVIGAVNGAAHAYQRVLLNHLVEPDRLPRALGVSATLNEVTYALAPVLASVLGGFSAIGAMVVITVIGTLPLLLIPSAPSTLSAPGDLVKPSRQRLPAEAMVWLYCAAAGSAVVSSVEVGAVAFASASGSTPGGPSFSPPPCAWGRSAAGSGSACATGCLALVSWPCFWPPPPPPRP